MKKSKVFISLLGVCSILVTALISFNRNDDVVAKALFSPSKTYTFGDGATYYNGISDSLTGDSLINALNKLNSSKRKTTMGYKKMGTSVSTSPYIYTDYDPSTVKVDKNGAKYGTAISSFYTYTSTTSFNKEHVWPNSHGGNKVESDIHMPRPTIPAENSSRGNSFFVEGMNHSSNGWDPLAAGYSEKSRGEAARIMMYCAIANTDLKLYDISKKTGSNQGGKLSTLLEWNLKYAPTQREYNRNEGAEYLQGNRNPFIDHPEYGCRIWGNTNEKTKSICSQSTTPPTKLTMSITEATIDVNETITLKVTSDTENTMVNWSSSNPTIASVNEGKVTGLKGGTAVITATSVLNSNVSCSATIIVNKAVELVSISLSGTANKKVYKEGESFDPTGITVTAHYDDESSRVIDNSFCTWSPDPLVSGILYIICTYRGMTANYRDFVIDDGSIQIDSSSNPDSSSSTGGSDTNIDSKGCGGSVIASSGLISLLSLTGIALTLFKKKKENK